MKVKVRRAVRSSTHDFQCFDEQQIIFPCGNTLCIKELARNQAEFICLSKHLKKLHAFKPATNRKGVFTAERSDSDVELAFYALNGDRKAISLSHQSPFFIEAEVIQLLADDYDNNIVYGWGRNHEGSCVFLGDFSKGKILALGYLPLFQDIKVDGRQNMTLSLCGHNGTFNYLKSLRYGLGQWQVQEWPYKKIAQNHGSVLTHELLLGGRMLLATKNSIYIFQEMNILQIHEMADKRIASLIKIPKGFLILLEDHTIELYTEQADELTFASKGLLPISLEEGDSIHLVHASFSGEEVLVRTVRNHLYRWRSEHVGLDLGHSEMCFKRIESSNCSGEQQTCLSISTGKRLCLLTGPTTATIWSLQTNGLVLRSDFSTTESSRKSISTSAIHPDGNSFILAFEDRIRIYKVLLTKFKFFAEFFMKRCSQIVYSHGGQLVACRYGRGANSCIQVINLLRLAEVSTIKVQAEPIQIVWNELDDELVVSAENRTVQVFRVADNIRTCNLKFQTPVLHVRLDYRVRKLLVSTAQKISVVDGGDIIDEIVPPIKGFQYVYPLYGLYFIVSSKGVLYWSTSLRFEAYSKLSLFRKKSFHLLCRNGFLLAHAGEDVLLLECIREGVRKRTNEGDVVMVEREEVMGVFDRVRDLESSLEMLQTATQSQLQLQKANYQRAIAKFKSQYTSEIAFLNTQLAQLTSSKLRQQRDTQKTFKQLQGGQVRNVHDLQQMFTRRLGLEKQRLMEAEQHALEEKQRYQKMIFELEGKYHREVGQVREQYARRTREEVQRVEDLKHHNLQDKERLEFKLLDLEEENEVAVADIQRDKDQLIEALRRKVMVLEGDYDTLLIKYHNQEEQLVGVQEQRQEGVAGLLQAQEMLREANNRVKMLEADVTKKIATIQEKNQVIRQQGHQIEGLEKAKSVLSMRTTEIRRQLQPKETLIDKLKAQLLKLDGQFKQQKRTVFQLGQRIEKLQKMGDVMKRQNFQMRSQLKLKERSYDDLSSQIFMVINTVDPKDWNAAFVKIYQAHIKDPSRLKLKGRRKDDSSEEINRHLIHVEHSLQQVSNANDKNLRRKEEELTKKMDENSNLLYELNLMRKNERLVEREKKEMGAAMERLKRELSDHHKSSNVISTRAQTTTATKRATASRDVISRDKSLLIDTSEYYAEPVTAREMKTRSRVRSRMSSGSKTPILRHETRQQSNKFFEIAKELHTCRNTIRVQDEVIEELNQRLFSNDAPQN